MSWTVLVKSPVIPQWADFSVTAPSGLVPWPAFYYGTEVVTVVGWWSYNTCIEIKVVSVHCSRCNTYTVDYTCRCR